MKIIRTLFFSLLFFLAIVFAVENNNTIFVAFYGMESFELPLFIIVFISIFLGILVAGLIWSLEGVKFRMEIGRLKKTIKENEEELNTLRNLPLSDSTESSQE